MRVHLIQNGLVDRHSHYLGLTMGWLEAGRDLGIPITVYGGTRIVPEVRQETGALPIFHYQADVALPRDSADLQRVATFVELGIAFAAGCQAIPPGSIAPGDLVVLDFASAPDMFGLALALGALPPARRPRVLCQFHVLDYELARDATDGPPAGDISTYRYAIRKLAATVGRDRVFLCTAAPALARALSRIFDHPCRLSPMPIRLGHPAVPTADAAPAHDVAVIGEFRPERGSLLLPDILRRLGRLRPGRSAMIQVRSAEQVGPLRHAADQASVPLSTLVGDLGAEDYVRALLGARILLLPYRPERYALRTSGVFAEAVAHGRVVVAPARTWMAEQIEAGRAAGVTFDAHTAGSVAQAVATAIDDLPRLESRARMLAPAWRQQHSSHALAAFAIALPAAGGGDPRV
ncbi:hypothetical protein STVA_39920 [Allostella vacuolata]|nr:hypothetical protein STVA_39920 [Stella vacuolata]